MASIFVNADQARKDTRNASVIHSEVRAIESAILTNIDAGILNVSVSSGTQMTDSNVYYNVYYGVSNDRSKLDQIEYVKKYFHDLGYGVTITENALTTDTLVWNISW